MITKVIKYLHNKSKTKLIVYFNMNNLLINEILNIPELQQLINLENYYGQSHNFK